MTRYIQKLYSIPAPGKGCHTALLGVANCGIHEGLSEEQIFADIRGWIEASVRQGNLGSHFKSEERLHPLP